MNVAACMSCHTLTEAARWTRLGNVGTEGEPHWVVVAGMAKPDAVQCPECSAVCLPDQDPPDVLVGDSRHLEQLQRRIDAQRIAAGSA